MARPPGPLRTHPGARLDLEAGAAALAMAFQPVVALTTGAVVGFEALARFPQPPAVGPDAWFADAQATGRAAWLEAEAVRRALLAPGRPDGTWLSLNLGPGVLGSPEVEAVLPRDLDGLVIEVTEHDLVLEGDGTVERLEALRARGARIAVDDVGTGYAALLRLALVRPDIVKLDRSLVRGVDVDPARRSLIAAFVDFACETDATVCAEGIETLSELEVLADLDVGHGQGYVLARPAPGFPLPAPAARDRCTARTAHALRTPAEHEDERGDRLAELVAARMAEARTPVALGAVMPLVARLLGADEVALSRLDDDGPALRALSVHAWTTWSDGFLLEDFPQTAQVLESREAVQVLAGDPEADQAELALLAETGYAALLMVAVVGRGRVLGLLEAYSRRRAPWTRRQISRARLVGHQAGTALAGF